MNVSDTLLGVVSIVVVISVITAVTLIGWRVINSLVRMLGQRGGFFQIIHTLAMLMIILLTISMFIPLLAGAFLLAVQDSGEAIIQTAQEVNQLIVKSIEGVTDGSFGTFSNSGGGNPPAPPPPPQGQLAPGPEIQPGDPDVGGGHGVPPADWVVPVQPSLPAPTVENIVPTLAPIPTATPRPTLEPTYDANTWNNATPAPTPEVMR